MWERSTVGEQGLQAELGGAVTGEGPADGGEAGSAPRAEA